MGCMRFIFQRLSRPEGIPMLKARFYKGLAKSTERDKENVLTRELLHSEAIIASSIFRINYNEVIVMIMLEGLGLGMEFWLFG